MIGVILISWFIAFFEYLFQVPANKLGYEANGGPFNLFQLKIIQEVITLTYSQPAPSLCSRQISCNGTMPSDFFFMVLAVFFYLQEMVR
jgi:uncharacterized protein (DUF486 family)